MGVQIYEGEKTVTGGDGIEVTPNKVVNVILRDENNLIKLNDNNELYTDLQLDDNLTFGASLPVGVTTGRVLQTNGRPVTGTLTASKTTSGDYTLYLYGDDGKVYVDNGNGIWRTIAYEYGAGDGINIDRETVNDYSAMRGPCDEGFHVPTSDEWRFVVRVGNSNGGTSFLGYLKLPPNRCIGFGNTDGHDDFYYWCCNASSSGEVSKSYALSNEPDVAWVLYPINKSIGAGIRAFKDDPVIPDSTWTLLMSWRTNAVYRNETLGLISVTNDGATWATIQDKNVGAVNVGDNGLYFQRGNNKGFTSADDATSTVKVDASGYAPSTYYADPIKVTSDWSTITNNNLWGGLTGVRTYTQSVINNTGVLSVNGETGHVDLNLGTAAYANIGTSEGNVPVLDANGKLDSSIVPSTGVMTSYTVTSKEELTTIASAVKGDIGIVTSENKTYILSNEPYSELSNWTELLFPTGSVSSVNGFTGAVNLTTGYIQESNDNLFVSAEEKAHWNNKLGNNDVASVAISGSYNDLNHKPTVDGTLNTSSTNAVQNKAVTTAVNTINSNIDNINTKITSIESAIGGAEGDISGIEESINTINSNITNIQEDITDIQGNLNVKAFVISSLFDDDIVQAAIDWYKEGNTPILYFNQDAAGLQSFFLESYSDTKAVFRSTKYDIINNISMTGLYSTTFDVGISNGSVTTMSINQRSILQTLEPSKSYSTPYTPQYNGSPATKKYVDDSIAGMAGGMGSIFGGSVDSVSCFSPGTSGSDSQTSNIINKSATISGTYTFIGWVSVSSRVSNGPDIKVLVNGSSVWSKHYNTASVSCLVIFTFNANAGDNIKLQLVSGNSTGRSSGGGYTSNGITLQGYAIFGPAN